MSVERELKFQALAPISKIFWLWLQPSKIAWAPAEWTICISQVFVCLYFFNKLITLQKNVCRHSGSAPWQKWWTFYWNKGVICCRQRKGEFFIWELHKNDKKSDFVARVRKWRDVSPFHGCDALIPHKSFHSKIIFWKNVFISIFFSPRLVRSPFLAVVWNWHILAKESPGITASLPVCRCNMQRKPGCARLHQYNMGVLKGSEFNMRSGSQMAKKTCPSAAWTRSATRSHRKCRTKSTASRAREWKSTRRPSSWFAATAQTTAATDQSALASNWLFRPRLARAAGG